jgi:hypothetical protein
MKCKNTEYMKAYRTNKIKNDWKYFSIMVPKDCYLELKRFYLTWKSNHLDEWDKK